MSVRALSRSEMKAMRFPRGDHAGCPSTNPVSSVRRNRPVVASVMTYTEVYVITLATTGLLRLTEDTGFVDGQPAWSPLGNRIAFISDRDSARTDIYLMDESGGNVKRLTTDSANDAQPAWSPAGDRIAFASDRSGGGHIDIFVMDTLGGNV